MKPGLLDLHPLHDKIYSTSLTPEFLESVKQNKVLEPIVYSEIGTDLVVLSGSRRLKAALQLDLEDVPVRKVDLDGLDAERFLIESNRQRVKTPEEIGREFTELERIEASFAKDRQKQGRSKSAHPEATGKAAVKAAAKTGVGRTKAKQLQELTKEADGGNEEAREALDAVNAGETSVNKAYQEVIGTKKQKESGPSSTRVLLLIEADKHLKHVGDVLKHYTESPASLDEEKEEELLKKLLGRVVKMMSVLQKEEKK